MTYIRVAFLGLLAVAIMTALWFRADAINARSEATQLRADLATAANVNKQNQATIATLRDDLRVSNNLARELAEQVEAIDRELDAATDELNALKDADATVSDYLSQPVPDALKRMYDRKTGGAGAN